MNSILVIGESCIDKFVYCKTERLSPEAPVPVLVPIETKMNEGMSGNVLKNLESLISNSKTFPKTNITSWFQGKDITKTRFIDKKTNHLFLRLDEGDENVPPFGISEETIEVMNESEIIIVSDYNKGFLSDEDLISIGKNSKLSILDSKRKLNKEIISSFTFVKLNENEANTNKDLLGCKNIIVTLGDKGCFYQDKIYPSPNPQETIDVSGAGDTFTASFILLYYVTKDIEQSINFANEMASIVVSKRGVVTPY